LVITPHTELAGKALTNRLHVSSTRHGQSETALSSEGEPAMLIVRQRAVVMALLIGQWSQHEVVGQGSATGKGQRFEQRC